MPSRRDKRVTKITESLNNLNKKDIYSLLLFTLYQLKNDPKFSVLSEMCYLLNSEDLLKMLNYFGGMTIRIPTLREMRLLVQALLIYQVVNIECSHSYSEALATYKKPKSEFSLQEIDEAYSKLAEVVSHFEFSREELNEKNK